MSRFSIVIPARNEEYLLPTCLESIRIAAEPFADQVEVIGAQRATNSVAATTSSKRISHNVP
jgi:hypothetical protein